MNTHLTHTHPIKNDSIYSLPPVSTTRRLSPLSLYFARERRKNNIYYIYCNAYNILRSGLAAIMLYFTIRVYTVPITIIYIYIYIYCTHRLRRSNNDKNTTAEAVGCVYEANSDIFLTSCRYDVATTSRGSEFLQF